MSKKSLASILKLQWWLHTLLTSLFFIVATFFFLFAIEDYLYEQQLTDISNIISINKSLPHLPEHIQLYPIEEAPLQWSTQLQQVQVGTAIEIIDTQGYGTHILRMQFSNQEFILALDTSKANSVWSISGKLLVLILPWIIIFLVIASFLANKLIRQLQDHFYLLLSTIKDNESPQELEKLAKAQSIRELERFAELFSEAWQQKLDILAREKQGLEYLSHELRTPIQSSLATLELLALKTEDNNAIERLNRSLKRMTRLSNSILYLMESEKSFSTYQVNVSDICQQLVNELIPLANAKNQTITIDTMARSNESENNESENTISLDKEVSESNATKIVATEEVIETLLSIVLTNALQHSNNKPIIVTLGHGKVSIENETKIATQTSTTISENHQSFGIGLTIAQRLADKFNLRLNILFQEPSKVIATISN